MSKITTASLAEKSNITEAALYRHFPSKRSIYAELFSFCDDTIFAKCNELKKEKISAQEKVKKIFIFFMLFIERVFYSIVLSGGKFVNSFSAICI